MSERKLIKFKTLQIRKQGSDKVIQIYPTPEEVTLDLFEYMSIRESIFESSIHGMLTIKEPSTVGDEFVFNGDEFIDIEFETPEIPESNHKLTFCVTEVNAQNIANSSGRLEGQPGYSLKFQSCESYYLNWSRTDYMFDEDFIGKIASDSEWRGTQGLVNTISEKYFNPNSTEYSFAQEEMDIENTKNIIWLDKNPHHYPWGKDSHPANLIQFMNYLTENSVTEDGSGMNYLFYPDLKKWNFKSVNKMIQDTNLPVGAEPKEAFSNNRSYIAGNGTVEDWEGRGYPFITDFNLEKNHDHFYAWINGGYSSYYELSKPNYSDPYHDYLDLVTAHQKDDAYYWGDKEIIDYNYHRDFEKWTTIEQYPLLSNDVNTAAIQFGEPVKSRRVYDDHNLYGYYGNLFNKKEENRQDFIAGSALDGKYGKTNDIVWQSMFDQTELSGDILYTIQKDIKKPTIQKYKEYVEKNNLKQKWKVYRNSICCDSRSASATKPVFFAMIDGAKLIHGSGTKGGIYQYTWKEVEIWPKEYGGETGEQVNLSPLEEHPFSIVEVENGLSSSFFAEDGVEDPNILVDPAYNLNEFMNSEIELDVFVGPGINVSNDDNNDYPEAYQMMPVGSYFQTDPKPCKLYDQGDGTEVPETVAHGHIVQMYSLPANSLNTMYIGEESPEVIYFFDVVNAHDGLCSC